MLSPNKFIVLLAFATVSPLVNSGINETVVKSEPTKVQSMARIPKKTSRNSTLSCWQEGRLIFQSKHIQPGTKKSDNKSDLILGANGKSIHLIDFKNGLCILEKAHVKDKKK